MHEKHHWIILGNDHNEGSEIADTGEEVLTWSLALTLAPDFISNSVTATLFFSIARRNAVLPDCNKWIRFVINQANHAIAIISHLTNNN